MKRVVALKTLPDTLMKDAAAVARFQREVEAAARLRHPNIVAADDADVANGVHFLVMEYVDGRDLAAIVKQDGPLPIKKAVNCILQAARGLKFAHDQGVVHRDIKPANLLLDPNGTIKILDMGLARVEQAGSGIQAELTSTGTIMGTIDYMAPEQAINTKNADHRADIYSLGISLYYLLSGKAAYGGETAIEKLMAHQNQPIPSLQDVQTTVPKELDGIFKKMVAKQVVDRFQSMSEVIEALEGLGFGGSISDPLEEMATQLTLSAADREKLASKAKRNSLGSITEAVVSEKSKLWVAKIVGGAFATIIAPILVTFLVKYMEKRESLPKPPDAAVPAAMVPPVAMASSTTSPQTVPVTGVVDPAMAKTSQAAAPVSPAPPVAKAPFDAAQAKKHQEAWAKHLGTQVETTNSVDMAMVLIPPGEFLMGSSDAQELGEGFKADHRLKDHIRNTERPQHKVVITKPFLMGATEVTVGQFKKFAAATGYQTEAEKSNLAAKAAAEKSVPAGQPAPAKYTPKATYREAWGLTDEHPAMRLTWNDAVEFCLWLSEQEKLPAPYETMGKTFVPTGQGYHLPTEAQWEYACRAGTTTQYWFGDDPKQLEGFTPAPFAQIGTKPPNPFGLHDMTGGAWEWCQDWFNGEWYKRSPTNDPTGPIFGSERVQRGGMWGPSEPFGRSAFRGNCTPMEHTHHWGFRIVRDLASTSTTASVAPQPAAAAGPAPPVAKAPFDAAQARKHQAAWARHLDVPVEYTNSIGMKFVLIPPGEFLMGSTLAEVEEALRFTGDNKLWQELIKSEAPKHKVILTQPIYLGVHEVTQRQYELMMGKNPSHFAAMGAGKQLVAGMETSDYPVETVSWNDAVEFCAKLSEKEQRKPFKYELRAGETVRIDGNGYRLPTEAEWEYACRAGTTTKYWIGDRDEDLMRADWFGTDSGGRTHAVGELKANPFGLFDIHGNIWEWVQDQWEAGYFSQFSEQPAISPSGPSSAGSRRVLKGGLWFATPSGCWSSVRHASEPTDRYYYYGFRVSLVVDGSRVGR